MGEVSLRARNIRSARAVLAAATSTECSAGLRRREGRSEPAVVV
jgi:hypothetical protein